MPRPTQETFPAESQPMPAAAPDKFRQKPDKFQGIVLICNMKWVCLVKNAVPGASADISRQAWRRRALRLFASFCLFVVMPSRPFG